MYYMYYKQECKASPRQKDRLAEKKMIDFDAILNAYDSL